MVVKEEQGKELKKRWADMHGGVAPEIVEHDDEHHDVEKYAFGY
jgi:hypothetical protein